MLLFSLFLPISSAQMEQFLPKSVDSAKWISWEDVNLDNLANPWLTCSMHCANAYKESNWCNAFQVNEESRVCSLATLNGEDVEEAGDAKIYWNERLRGSKKHSTLQS